MAGLVWKDAREQAKAIRSAYRVSRHGLSDLERVAGILGAEVFYEKLPKDQAGFIVKRPEEPFASIVINKRDIPERQRFTLAHEIGHLVDRQRMAGDERFSFMDYRDNRNNYSLHEFFADEFAGELLMPAIPLLTELARSSQYEVAAKFGVTPAAVDRRIARLQKNLPEELMDA
ncbi:ImmA/IrrE family metallo-endopeptidase [Corynebacterium glucuronolyticum]|uniref:ImmA/IrrE family metallo-endopeptidase n=1 Tax=Corynebacterium glucuronolyticum TaxID=39791 RepID=UPI00223AB8C4|nr:ImmA/IrrE family metallo-endopeptidase [Corynebacterium glucuronolyticum]MCT1442231.1 ImmA/IrrE family metallo-endopeptidase [Corynebacterium glucuronolyticum]